MLQEKIEVPIVSPEAVEVRHFPGQFSHNAIWDIFAGPDGRIYVSVCAEGSFSASAMLYAYDIAKDKMEHVFDVEKVTHAPPRTIPQSKIHTSMAAMEDGRLIMCTHTTASAPGHPFWAPYQCYDDIWEGYPGSHMIVYDPKTNHAEDWGIPVPRETTYGGGCYVEQAREYYMQGMMRGHLYAFNVDTGKTRDLGRVGIGIRLFHDDDGRVYGMSGDGVMFRYDPFKDVLEDLDLPIPDGGGVLGYVDRGPDDLFYIVRLYSQSVFAFDPRRGRQGEIREIGQPMPDAERFRPKDDQIGGRAGVHGLRFAPDGVLYCGLPGGPLHGMVAFVRWDFLRGKEPEFLGILYAEGRQSVCLSEMAVGYDGRLYIADSNFHRENPRMLILDPHKATVPGADRLRLPRPVWRVLPDDQRQAELQARSGNCSIRAVETVTIPLSRKVLPTGESDVVGLAVDDLGRFHIATTGKGGGLAVWDGKSEHLPVALHRDEEGFVGLATDGSIVFAATGPNKHWLLAYDARQTTDGKSGLCVIATFPEDCAPTTLSFDRTSGRLYGLAGPSHHVFTCENASRRLKIGPATGALMAGRRTVIAAKDGCLYGALDEGWVFRYEPKSDELERLEVRLPGLHGRQYATRWESAALRVDGAICGGTSDGYLFRFDPATRTIRNLGKPALSLGMPALALAADGTVYGLTGTRDDLSRLFRYTETEGVRDLGMTVPVATCLAVMPDGSIFVAGADRLNDLALYRF